MKIGRDCEPRYKVVAQSVQLDTTSCVGIGVLSMQLNTTS